MSRVPVRLRSPALLALLALLAACAFPAAAAAETEIEASPTQVRTGQRVSLTARTWPIPWPPESTETFYDSGSPIAGCENVEIAGEGGAAFCETAFTSPGEHQISASYSGTEDGEYPPSSSGQIAIEVAEETTTTLSLPSSKAKVGERFAFSAFTTPGFDLGESTDTFFDNGAPIEGCEVEVFGEGGMGFCEETFSTPGVHRLSVSFSGTANGEYLPSSSGQAEVEVEPAGSEEESPAGEEEPAGEGGGAGPKEPAREEASNGSEGPEGPGGRSPESPQPPPPLGHAPPPPEQPNVPLSPFAAPLSASSSLAQASAPRLVSRPALLVINARHLRLAVRCGSAACALSAGVSVRAGRRRWQLPVTVRPATPAGYAHVLVGIPARERAEVRSFLLAHPRARRSVRVVLGERTLSSTATLLLRTKRGLR